MSNSKSIFTAFFSFFILSSCVLSAYPIDGYLFTGIKRLLRLERIQEGLIKDKAPVNGALLKSSEIKLNLLEHSVDDFPELDPNFQSKVNSLFPRLDDSYSISVMDLSDSTTIRYMERKADRGFQPGSVGKLAVVTGLFCELENIYPIDFGKRIELLKNKKVRAGKFAIPNIHTVPFFNVDKNTLEKRLIIESDVFSLYEWLDHMLSVSSNGAASVVWREIMLMRNFGEKYETLTEDEANAYFKETSRKELSDVSIDVVNTPLREIGIGEEEWRLGTFFTRGGSNVVPPQGGSIATPKALMKWLWNLEHGNIIDKESSLEIKKLLYMTDRRIRYAANPNLNDAAVYFKSGSLYKCKSEPGYACGKYLGNVYNYMNSVAIVEHTNGKKYMVALMTNVLKKNSNSDHNSLGGQIDKLINI